MDADRPIIESCSRTVAEVLAKVKKAGEQSLQVSQRSLAAKVVQETYSNIENIRKRAKDDALARFNDI